MPTMGQDIERTRFDRHDFSRFEARLRAETEVLHELVEQRRLSSHAPVAGLELEAWLIDRQGRPAPCNDAFIERWGSPDVVMGARTLPTSSSTRTWPSRSPATGSAAWRQTFQAWRRCAKVASAMGLKVVIGPG